MSDRSYTYAVARIRALESGLFTTALIEQLLGVRTYEGCLRFLAEHGWGDADTPLEAGAMLERERQKAWGTVRELLTGPASALRMRLLKSLE